MEIFHGTQHNYLCLHLQGKVLSFPEVAGHVIVTDIAWFMRVLVLMQHQKDNISLQNGAHCKALAPDVPLFDLVIIQGLLSSEATPEQVGQKEGKLINFS